MHIFLESSTPLLFYYDYSGNSTGVSKIKKHDTAKIEYYDWFTPNRFLMRFGVVVVVCQIASHMHVAR